MSGADGACPQCGAPIQFSGAHCVAAVCTYCRAAVVRSGVKPELIGTVPDLVATGTALQLGDSGRLGKQPFRVVGRLQLDQGAAAWDEWYLAFADGTDGWLAEAKGQLFATRRARADSVPAFESLAAGARVRLAAGHADLAIDELGTATFVSALGELPFAPRVGATYRFADLSGAQGEFATLDYGEPGDSAVLFAGRSVTYAEAALAAAIDSRKRGRKTAAAGTEGTALACPNCGAPIAPKRTESEAATCPSCRALLDLTRGTLAVLGKLGARTEPLIPLGSRGVLRGEAVEVLGYLRRYTEYRGMRFSWSEWQLASESGYRWITEYNGHFLRLAPIAAGEVEGDARDEGSVRSGGIRYAHYQTASARYQDIQGELSWLARVDSTVQVYDFVEPPHALSCEVERSEVNWSRGDDLEAKELWAAFKLPGAPPARVGVGMAQVNPWQAAKWAASRTAFLGFWLLIALAIFVGATLPRQPAVTLGVPLVNEQVALSDEFELPDASQALQVDASAELTNGWVGLDLALISAATGEARTLGLELSHFEGVDEGERWSEGTRAARAVLGAVPRGRYLLRAEVSLDKSAANLPPAAHLLVTRGVFVWSPFLLALLALLPAPLVVTLLASSFERRRREGGDHASGAAEEDE